MKVRRDSESIGHGPRVTRCVGCGVDVFNDSPYYRRDWHTQEGRTACLEGQEHKPRDGWDARKPGR